MSRLLLILSRRRIFRRRLLDKRCDTGLIERKRQEQPGVGVSGGEEDLFDIAALASLEARSGGRFRLPIDVKLYRDNLLGMYPDYGTTYE